MNGASALPFTTKTNTLNAAKMRKMGMSQNFFRTIRKRPNSAKNDSIVSELVFQACKRLTLPFARNPIRRRRRLFFPPQRISPKKLLQYAERDYDQKKYRR